MRNAAFVAGLLCLSPMVWADCPYKGTWVQRSGTKEFGMTMTAEDAGPGCKLTYRASGTKAPPGGELVIVSMLDGKDAPNLLDGKPTGQTMAIRTIDSRHWVTVLKYQGKQTGISKGELSPDGKVLKSEDEMAASGPNASAVKNVQYWDKR